MHNERLLTKWLWRRGMEARLGKGDFRQTWCQMEWITNPINSPHGLGLRKYIKSLWPNFEHCGNQSGRSRITKFWQDSWIGTPLLELNMLTCINFERMQGLQYLIVETIGVGAFTSKGTVLIGKYP